MTEVPKGRGFAPSVCWDYFRSRVEVLLEEDDTERGGKTKEAKNEILIFEIEPIPSDINVAAGENESRACNLVGPEPPRELSSQWRFVQRQLKMVVGDN
jgi:hypothetical protein